MPDDVADKSLKERYGMLQSLCREQLMVNESLKAELGKLNGLLQKVSREKSILLNELLENHSSCSKSSIKVESSFGCNIVASDNSGMCNKRTSTPGPLLQVSKKSRYEQSVSDVKPGQSLELHHLDVPMNANEKNDCDRLLWTEQDADEVARHISPDFGTSAIPNTVSGAQTPKLQQLTTQLNQTTSSVPNWSSQFSSPGSPPPVVGSHVVTTTVLPTQPQRSSKAASLVTSSSITSAGSSIPFVPLNNQKNAVNSQLQSVRGVPLSGRTIGSVQNPHSNINLLMSPNNRETKLVQAPQTSASVKLSCSTPGQRIFIQSSHTNPRPIVVHPSEKHVSGLSEGFQ